MALSDGLRLGGVHLTVRLDRSQIPADIRALKSDIERTLRSERVGVPVGMAAGSGSSGAPRSSGAGSGAAGVLQVAGLSGLAGLKTELTKQSALLARVAAATGFMAAQARQQDKAARFIYNADRADFRRAGLAASMEQIRTGRFTRIDRTQGGAVNAAPADVRFLGGIGFDEAGGYRARIRRPGSAASTQAAPSAVVQRVASDVAPVVAEAMAQAARTAAATASAGRETVTGGYAMKPGRIRGRRPMAPGAESTIYGVVGEASDEPGTVSGNFRRGRRRSGSVDLSMAGDAAGLAARVGARGLTEMVRLVPRVTGLIGLMGDASILAFNGMQQRIAANNMGLQRFRTTLGPFGYALALPFRLAALPLRLFGHGVDETGRKLGTVHTLTRAMRDTAATPFRVANGAAGMLLGTLRAVGTHLAIMGGIHAAGSLFSGVGGASNMAETINVTQATFSTAAGSVRRDASTMASQFGLVEEAVLRSANGFGLLLTGMGMGQAEAATMSTRLAKLTADMSSFFNVSQEDAATSVRAALRGEFDPIERFGVSMRKSDVTALAEARGETTRLGEATAALDLIFRGLSPAMGDLERTLNSNANLTRELAGRSRNAATSLGETLLPAVREAKLLMTDLFSFGNGQSPMAGFFRAAGEQVQLFVRFVRVAIANFGTFVEAGRMAAVGVGTAFGRLFSYVMDAGRTFFGWFLENWRTILTDMGSAFMTFTANFGKNAARLGQAVKDFASGKGWNFEAKGLLDGFQAATPAMPALPALDLGIGDTVKRIGDMLLGAGINTNLRGAGGEATGEGAARGQLVDPMGADEGKSKEGRSSGSLVSAQALAEIQAGDAAKKLGQRAEVQRDRMIGLLETMRQDAEIDRQRRNDPGAVGP